MAGVRDNTVSNVVSGGIASFKSVGEVPLKSLKVNFNPIQEGDGDPSPSNVRAISGWTGLNVFRSESKNILDPFNNPIWNYNVYSVNQSGEITVTGSDGRGWTGTQISPLNLVKGTYTISYTGGGNCNLRTSIDDYETNYNTTNGHLTFTLTEDAGVKFKFSGKTYPATFYVQIEPGQTTHDYESYKPFATVPVSWSDLGTVYGGYIDLIKGKVIAEWEIIDKPWSQWTNYSTSSANFDIKTALFTNSVYVAGQTGYQYMCNIAKQRWAWTEDTTPHYYFSHITNPESWRVYMFLPKDFDPTQNIQILGKLVTPIEYDIDPITIKSLIGVNNIWSNADSVDAQYCALESLQIYKQRFKTNEPHLQNASGNIASFQTDMVAPLKECKVYFQPIQASGTPSPDNVLPISGWNNLEVYRTSKNIRNWTITDTTIPLNYGGQFNGFGNGYWDNYWVIPKSLCGKTITYSVEIVRAENPTNEYAEVRCWTYTSSGELVQLFLPPSSQRYYTGSGRSTLTFTVPENVGRLGLAILAGEGDRIYNPIVSIGSTAVEYEPYNGTTTSITLPSTFYGGYVDLTKGELIATYGYKKFIGNEDWFISGGISNYCAYRPTYLHLTQAAAGSGGAYYLKPISDKLMGQAAWATYEYYCTINDAGHFYFGAPEELSTKAAVNAWIQEIGGIEIVYPLRTPITYQLTSQQIKTLKGLNNIWSNTNGITEVKYWTHGSITF